MGKKIDGITLFYCFCHRNADTCELRITTLAKELNVFRRHTILAMLAAIGILAGSVVAAPRTPTRLPPRVTPPPSPRANPLLPPQVHAERFFPELTLVQKQPTQTPADFEPLYTAEDWTTYQIRFAATAEELPRKRSSSQIEFATTLITAAETETSPGLKRLLLLRAAAICYRSTAGYPTADRAVAEYQQLMDINSPAQVGALWTIANAMSRLSVTPKPDRIRYSGIAAQANMQLAILLLQADQVEAAQSMMKHLTYHEGWLRGNTPPHAHLQRLISQTRTVVRQTAAMMDHLATQYRPALTGDDHALMQLYLYGQFVKNDPALVADFPSRKPTSPMAQLANLLQASEWDLTATFTAAESLRTVASALPDGILKQRTQYAALERYRKFIRSPATERERVKRTQSQIAIESLVSDGATLGITIQPFTQPPTQPTN